MGGATESVREARYVGMDKIKSQGVTFPSSLDLSFSKLPQPILFLGKSEIPSPLELFREYWFWGQMITWISDKSQTQITVESTYLSPHKTFCLVFVKDPRNHLTPKPILSKKFKKRRYFRFFGKKNRLRNLAERALRNQHVLMLILRGGL